MLRMNWFRGRKASTSIIDRSVPRKSELPIQHVAGARQVRRVSGVVRTFSNRTTPSGGAVR
jgi:hypothetical protein